MSKKIRQVTKRQEQNEGVTLPRGLRLRPEELTPLSVRVWLARLANAMLQGKITEGQAGKAGYIGNIILGSLEGESVPNGGNGFMQFDVQWKGMNHPQSAERMTVITAIPPKNRPVDEPPQ